MYFVHENEIKYGDDMQLVWNSTLTEQSMMIDLYFLLENKTVQWVVKRKTK